MKLRKGDHIQVLTGKDRGEQGEILRVNPRKGRVLVDGVNAATKHQRPTQQDQNGGIIEKIMPLDASNVAILCHRCGPTRIGYSGTGEDKVRICKKCGEELK